MQPVNHKTTRRNAGIQGLLYLLLLTISPTTLADHLLDGWVSAAPVYMRFGGTTTVLETCAVTLEISFFNSDTTGRPTPVIPFVSRIDSAFLWIQGRPDMTPPAFENSISELLTDMGLDAALDASGMLKNLGETAAANNVNCNRMYIDKYGYTGPGTAELTRPSTSAPNVKRTALLSVGVFGGWDQVPNIPVQCTAIDRGTGAEAFAVPRTGLPKTPRPGIYLMTCEAADPPPYLGTAYLTSRTKVDSKTNSPLVAATNEAYRGAR